MTKRVCSLAARLAASWPERSIAAPLCSARADATLISRGALHHRSDEARGIARAARELAGRRDLLLDRARDRREHRPDRRDRRHDAVHGRDRFLRVVLQLVDLAADLLGRVLRRARERLHLARHDRKATARVACAYRLDRGVEREQIGLLGDRRDQAHHIADFRRRGFQPVDTLSGRRRRMAGIFGQRTGLAHLSADLIRTIARIPRSRTQGAWRSRSPRSARASSDPLCPRMTPSTSDVVRVPPRTASDGALDVADHRREIGLDQVDGLADRRHRGALRFIGIHVSGAAGGASAAGSAALSSASRRRVRKSRMFGSMSETARARATLRRAKRFAPATVIR